MKELIGLDELRSTIERSGIEKMVWGENGNVMKCVGKGNEGRKVKVCGVWKWLCGLECVKKKRRDV